MSELQMTDEIREFFEEKLPSVIRGRPDLFLSSQGNISIQVQNVGAWTLRFGDAHADDAITSEFDIEADLLLVFSAPSMAAILAGSAQNEHEKPIVFGDLKLLERLGSLMLPAAKGGVGARLWGT